ncbi:ERG1 [Candida oxycetoniae]|uniref:Squalene monooxygenase n=1 Tax=Candida oxycetoniae TaxID=497107 RepID=A0AAI9X0B3_9ASCO|nr:ERG1 [Candida oxycetoniae]KAI3406790.2 ERG1 [Candida oxycetoniae]
MEYDTIVIGAGVIGPCIATAFARQGRKVLIVERDWSKPDRIVGELMQPAGIKALRELGMVKAVNNIEAIECTGYYIQYFNHSLSIDYPLKEVAQVTNPMKPIHNVANAENEKLESDTTLDMKAWDEDERVRGVAFHHGDFLQNLRAICKNEPNVTAVEATVTEILRDQDDPDTVIGVRAKSKQDGVVNYNGKLVISCDGIYSKFRKELSPDNVPVIGSHFVGLYLKNAKLPANNKGHVLLGKHAPVLIYRVSPTETRVLCAFRSAKAPSAANDEIYKTLKNEVLPAIPKETVPSFVEALEERKFRVMPNQYLSAMKQGKQNGFILLGDSLNMRHPLTGGGMTVGLNDAVLLAKLLNPHNVEDFSDHQLINEKMSIFHRKRKNLDAVINTLSIALYSLFAADKNALQILQMGCFEYFKRGGECVSGPIGLLSGMLPFPMLLFNHFFSVAFYSIYVNFKRRGLVEFPIALWEAFDVLFTAVAIFTPYLWAEVVR